jgi:hypothetical protein
MVELRPQRMESALERYTGNYYKTMSCLFGTMSNLRPVLYKKAAYQEFRIDGPDRPLKGVITRRSVVRTRPLIPLFTPMQDQ